MVDEASVTIAAAPERVWALVSDPTRMGEFSPSNTGAKWLPGKRGPAVGARFLGFNKRGLARWFTTCTVIEYDPPRAFAFKVLENRSHWGFRLEPTADGGTRLTQWRNRPSMPLPPVRWVAGLLFQGKLDEEMVDGIRATLQAIKARVERSAPS